MVPPDDAAKPQASDGTATHSTPGPPPGPPPAQRQRSSSSLASEASLEPHLAAVVAKRLDNSSNAADALSDAGGAGATAGDAPAEQPPSPPKHLLRRLSPWICMPNRPAKWATFIVFWLVVGGGTAYGLLWCFSRFVDHVVEPTAMRASARLLRWQFGAVLSLCIVVLPLAFVPPLPFIWVAAMLYSMWEALLIVNVAVTASMALGYLAGRHLLRARAARLLERYPLVRDVLHGAVESAGPLRLALLVRLGPLPFTVENYVMAVPPRITMLPYLVGSVLGQLPGNALGVYFGRNLQSLSAMVNGRPASPGQTAYNIISLVLSVGLVAAGFWYARRALRRIREQQQGEQENELAGGEPAQEESQNDGPQGEELCKQGDGSRGAAAAGTVAVRARSGGDPPAHVPPPALADAWPAVSFAYLCSTPPGVTPGALQEPQEEDGGPCHRQPGAGGLTMTTPFAAPRLLAFAEPAALQGGRDAAPGDDDAGGRTPGGHGPLATPPSSLAPRSGEGARHSGAPARSSTDLSLAPPPLQLLNRRVSQLRVGGPPSRGGGGGGGGDAAAPTCPSPGPSPAHRTSSVASIGGISVSVAFDMELEDIEAGGSSCRSDAGADAAALALGRCSSQPQLASPARCSPSPRGRRSGLQAAPALGSPRSAAASASRGSPGSPLRGGACGAAEEAGDRASARRRASLINAPCSGDGGPGGASRPCSSVLSSRSGAGWVSLAAGGSGAGGNVSVAPDGRALDEDGEDFDADFLESLPNTPVRCSPVGTRGEWPPERRTRSGQRRSRVAAL